ncbi:hypothetical protein GCM10017710_26080 [Arthrobacter ramosus]
MPVRGGMPVEDVDSYEVTRVTSLTTAQVTRVTNRQTRDTSDRTLAQHPGPTKTTGAFNGENHDPPESHGCAAAGCHHE